MPRLLQSVTEEDHSQGRADAPVTLVEYGDYQCPSCGQAYLVIKALQQEMGERLRVVFRNFPLSTLHNHAEHAAEAAETAGALGQFWPMHDTLYEHQRALADGDLLDYAAQLGLDADAFGRAMTEHAYAERVRKDFQGGLRSGVNGTPTYFINGERYDGPFDRASLRTALERAAAEA